jgi:hypothetical protein
MYLYEVILGDFIYMVCSSFGVFNDAAVRTSDSCPMTFLRYDMNRIENGKISGEDRAR